MKDVSSDLVSESVAVVASGVVVVDVTGHSCSILDVCGRGKMEILGLISVGAFAGFLINSNGISSDLGRGIRGLPSRERLRFELLSLDFAGPFFSGRFGSIRRPGLSLNRDVLARLLLSDGVLSRRGVANPGTRPVLNSGRFSLDPLPLMFLL